MTDSTPWQPPAGATPPPAPSPYAAPPVAPPPVQGQPGWAPPGAAPGWTPPPKPGLIPLRPLTFGTLLGASFQVMRRNPRPTFGFALLITGLIYVVTIAAVGIVSVLAFSRLAFSEGAADADTIAAGAWALVILTGVASGALFLVGSAILQGVISLEVARATLGEKLRLPGLWRAAKGRIGALIGWSALVALAVTLAIALAAVLIGLLVALGGVAGTVIGVLLGIVLFLGGLVLAAWLGTKLALVPSVLMLERLPLRDAVARSWSLTRFFFWKTFGTLLLVALIIYVAQQIIATPLSLFVGFGSTFLDPNSSSAGSAIAVIVVSVLSIIVTVVFGAIGSVVQAATPALIYIDIRMRKEGLDLELSRFVEARQAGDSSVADPYLVAAAPGPVQPAPSTSPWS